MVCIISLSHVRNQPANFVLCAGLSSLELQNPQIGKITSKFCGEKVHICTPHAIQAANHELVWNELVSAESMGLFGSGGGHHLPATFERLFPHFKEFIEVCECLAPNKHREEQTLPCTSSCMHFTQPVHACPHSVTDGALPHSSQSRSQQPHRSLAAGCPWILELSHRLLRRQAVQHQDTHECRALEEWKVSKHAHDS